MENELGRLKNQLEFARKIIGHKELEYQCLVVSLSEEIGEVKARKIEEKALELKREILSSTET